MPLLNILSNLFRTVRVEHLLSVARGLPAVHIICVKDVPFLLLARVVRIKLDDSCAAAQRAP